MAKFTMESYEQQQEQKSVSKDYAKVGYFNSLKNDKDEAIVRFDYSNANEFDLLVAHRVKVGDFYRYISCLREANEPIEKCPLCQANEKVTLRFFVKLVEYVKDENGNIIPTAKIWDRPASFAKDLKGYIDEYGDLKNLVFKIKRNGAKGDMHTTYTLVVPNQTVYNEANYVKDFTAFDTLDLGHHSYYDLNYDEVNYFVTTGEIPQREKEETTPTQQTAQTTVAQPQQNVTYQQAGQNPYQPQQPIQQQPVQQTTRRTYNY